MSSLIKNLPQNQTQAKYILESFEIAYKTCNYPSVFSEAENLPGVGVTFHDLAVILSGIATIMCLIISFYIICGHLFHWVLPKEQKQIVLCVLYLPVFASINFYAGWFTSATWELIPITQIYNAKGLVAVFLLFVAYLCPEGISISEYHRQLQRQTYKGNKRHDKGSLRWFRIIWVLVFQLIPVTLITFPINYIIIKLTCPLDDSRATGAYILSSVQFVSTSISWLAMYAYYHRHMAELDPRRSIHMLNAFQSLVGLQATQELIFTVIATKQAYHPTSYVSFLDFANTVPAFITCWESFIWSVWFLKVFSFTPYREAVLREREAKPASVQRGLLDTVNQMDLVYGTVYMFRVMFCVADRKDRRDLEKLNSKEVTRNEDEAATRLNGVAQRE